MHIKLFYRYNFQVCCSLPCSELSSSSSSSVWSCIALPRGCTCLPGRHSRAIPAATPRGRLATGSCPIPAETLPRWWRTRSTWKHCGSGAGWTSRWDVGIWTTCVDSLREEPGCPRSPRKTRGRSYGDQKLSDRKTSLTEMRNCLRDLMGIRNCLTGRPRSRGSKIVWWRDLTGIRNCLIKRPLSRGSEVVW